MYLPVLTQSLPPATAKALLLLSICCSWDCRTLDTPAGRDNADIAAANVPAFRWEETAPGFGLKLASRPAPLLHPSRLPMLGAVEGRMIAAPAVVPAERVRL
jgi:hypothetical protein